MSGQSTVPTPHGSLFAGRWISPHRKTPDPVVVRAVGALVNKSRGTNNDPDFVVGINNERQPMGG